MSTLRGDIAEAMFDLQILEIGWFTVEPRYKGLPWDRLIASSEKGPWHRIQVKRTYGDHDTINMTRWDGKMYMPSNFDFVAAVNVPLEHIWLIPSGMICGATRRRVGGCRGLIKYDGFRLTEESEL